MFYVIYNIAGFVSEDSNSVSSKFIIGFKVMSLHHCIYYTGKRDGSKIFQAHSADVCDIIVNDNHHRMVNRLVADDLFPTCAKEDGKNTTDIYDKSDKIVDIIEDIKK